MLRSGTPNSVVWDAPSPAPAVHTSNGVCRRPVILQGMAGCLHTPAGKPVNDTAILICPGLSHDALDAYHSLRVVADEFARAGYATLRFDYPGSGDSCELDASDFAIEDGHWAAWLAGTNAAADMLCNFTGASRLVFCGLRLGATIATHASHGRDDLAGLLLLAPVLRGHSYLRQMEVEAGFQANAADSSTGLDFHELSLSTESVRALKAADLREVRLPPGCQVALFAQAPSRLLKELTTAWVRQGAVVESHDFVGLEPLLNHDTQGDTVPADAAPLLEWLCRVVQTEPQLQQPCSEEKMEQLRFSAWCETPLRFGSNNRLFGVLCMPVGHRTDQAVIILNTGRSPRQGVARFGAKFARQLAAAGIASLRFDFAGLGESDGPPGAEDQRSDVFEDDRIDDIRAALDMMEKRGFRQFALQGLCSGSYHAFHGGLRDARVSALLLVNLPLFIWQKGDSIAASKQRTFTFGHYGNKLANRAAWLKLLRGQSDVVGIVRAQMRRVLARAKGHDAPTTDLPGLADSVIFARLSLADLARRPVHTVFLYDADNVGVYNIEQHFGRAGEGLRDFSGASIQILPGLGDALATNTAQQTVSGILIEALNSFWVG
jgi:pimeloyl-ACP methyl ester carboxylesterase